MRKHPDISRHYEHDSRHFTFVRNSRLPHGTFEEKRSGITLDVVIVAFAVMIILALLLEVPFFAVLTGWLK